MPYYGIISPGEVLPWDFFRGGGGGGGRLPYGIISGGGGVKGKNSHVTPASSHNTCYSAWITNGFISQYMLFCMDNKWLHLTIHVILHG